MVDFERWVFDEAVSFVREYDYRGSVLDEVSPIAFKALIDAGYLEQQGRFVRPTHKAYVDEFIDRMVPRIRAVIVEYGPLRAYDWFRIGSDLSPLVSEGWFTRLSSNQTMYVVTEVGESLLKRTARLYEHELFGKAGPEGFEPTT